MKTDDEVGFYLGNSWKFWVNNAGDGYLNGILVQTSDLRLKRDFTPLSNSLAKIAGLKGYHYYWKDKAGDQSLQTGLIAQDVEELFPELVKTDEKGFKSVNYIGLIPHLIESVKQLARENWQLKAENEKLNVTDTKHYDEGRRIIDQLRMLEDRIDKIASGVAVKTIPRWPEVRREIRFEGNFSQPE